MKLKIRKSQLVNRIEAIEEALSEKNLSSGEVFDLNEKRVRLLERVREIEFLLGDLTKDIKVLK